jgi:hypothetical protein
MFRTSHKRTGSYIAPGRIISCFSVERRYGLCCQKFGLSLQEFDTIMAVPPKTYWDYPSYDKSQNIVYYRLLRFLKKLWLRAHPKEFPELFQ